VTATSGGRAADTATRPGSAVATSPEVASPRPRPRRGGRNQQHGRTPGWVALLWLGPALLLIGGVVIYPAIALVRASFSEYSITGLRKGPAGWSNYSNVLHHDDLLTVVQNTVVWVVTVVALTVLISLALAQFLAKQFVGRRVVRWAIIVPWAASLVITARLFTLVYDYNYSILNSLLIRSHIVDKPIDFLGDDRWTMPSMVAVGIFVSIPFTAYVFLAGLSAIPDDVNEAARMDGAGPWQLYTRITLPLLRPAILVATVLNLIYVFNSFPIVYTLNERNPGFLHDTSITFAYKLAFKSAEKDVGMSAAAGVFNVIFILAIVVLYLRVAKPQRDM
jgi:multiple sugar transport system permease protein